MQSFLSGTPTTTPRQNALNATPSNSGAEFSKSTLRRSSRQRKQAEYIFADASSDGEELQEEYNHPDENKWSFVPEGPLKRGLFLYEIQVPPVSKIRTPAKRNAFTILAEASRRQSSGIRAAGKSILQPKNASELNIVPEDSGDDYVDSANESIETEMEGDAEEDPEYGVEDDLEEDGSKKENVDKKAPKPKKPKLKAPMTVGEVVEESSNSQLAKFWQPPSLSQDPPLFKIQDMFKDLVERSPDLIKVAKHLEGRKLRFATMCSGTESPLLSLRMIAGAMQEHFGSTFEVEHLFSCEIEPFKQKYIERNFKPAILFRDVCELANGEATTCYGSKVKVPENCDLLVAGTSCVDFSNLNNQRKELKQKGESGRTFFGMKGWVEKNLPKIVVLENVCNAPWDAICEEFRKLEYVAEWCRFDTKEYYIPHTRQRGYMVAIFQGNPKRAEEWVDVVKKLKRPASCTVESFLLDPEDPRVIQARERVEAPEAKTKINHWTACQIRHESERHKFALGDQRPLINWTEGGKVTPPNWWNLEWARTQPHRVLDALEIIYMKNANYLVDTSYKTKLLNLSQNVDRNIEGTRSGIMNCITPNGIAYVTTLGRPLTGHEALGLQGIPVEQLLLTRESDAQLKDLAGNAMTTTVVGAAMIAALITGRDVLTQSSDTLTGKSNGLDVVFEDSSNRIINSNLTTSFLDLTAINGSSLSELLDLARRSARLCDCEGRNDLILVQVQRCSDCGDTSCIDCGKNPEHSYEILASDNMDRVLPTDFENQLKAVLPMILKITGINEEMLLAAKVEASTPLDVWGSWLSGACMALSSEFRFSTLKRGRQWVVYYDSPHASLELALDPAEPHWRLFYRVPLEYPANSPLRALFSRPVARMRTDLTENSLLSGTWEVCFPTSEKVRIRVAGDGELVKSWRNSLGLQRFDEEMVWPKLVLTAQTPSMDPDLEAALRGTWSLLPKCGTACRSLHKKDGSESRPLFLFLDPTRSEDPTRDCFVLSHSCRRYASSECRPIMARMEPGYLPPFGAKLEPKVIECARDGRWVRFATSRLAPATLPSDASPAYGFAISKAMSTNGSNCRNAPALLFCQAPVSDHSNLISDEWSEINETHERLIFSEIAWLTERTKFMLPSMGWEDITASHLCNGGCQTCAPTPPSLAWCLNRKNKFVPVEDPVKAAPYERSLKCRPAPWVSQIKQVEGKLIQLQIGLNLATLSHRATDALAGQAEAVSWKLTTNYLPPVKPKLGRFVIQSNQDDSPAQQPQNFVLPLRLEQLRSLGWMLRQEAGCSGPFLEEEVVEAVHEQMLWRAEVKAVRNTHVLGGVIADEVGFGKTATVLALLDSQRGNGYNPDAIQGRISVKGTLVVVPAHLIEQWTNEISKFINSKRTFKMCTLKDMAALNRTPVAAIVDADLVIMASSLFMSNAYTQNLAAFGGTYDPPNSNSNKRRHEHWFRHALNGLGLQIDLLKDNEIGQVQRVIQSSGNIPSNEHVAEESKRSSGPKPASKTGQKRKQEDDSDPEAAAHDGKVKPSKQNPMKKRRGKDIWKLAEASKRGWEVTRAIPIEAYYFQRVVVDEFTYNFHESTIHTSIINIGSRYKWVMSGTPPLGDFSSVKSVAQYLGINLGVDYDASFRKYSGASAERAQVEAFQFFEKDKTSTWHENRHSVAQRFIDQFMRQNIAEIGEIVVEQHKIPLTLSAGEKALYLEVDHHLKAMGVFTRRNLPTAGSDRSNRVHRAIGDSASSEEALLKSCSLLKVDLKGQTVHGAVRILRETECETSKANLRRMFSNFFHLREKYAKLAPGNTDDMVPLDNFIGRQKVSQNDYQVSKTVNDLIRLAEDPETRSKYKMQRSEDNDDGRSHQLGSLTSPSDVLALIKRVQHKLQLLLREAVYRSRAFRFFKMVDSAQTQEAPNMELECPKCLKPTPFKDLSLTSTCGHVGCDSCVRLYADSAGECVEKAAQCAAKPKDTDVVTFEELRQVSDGQQGGDHMQHGSKVQTLVHLLKEVIPYEDKAILFVQFRDQLSEVAAALTACGIRAQTLEPRSKASELLEEFKSDTDPDGLKVLLLEPLSESASGANLTNANHVIFFSPLFTPDRDTYQACETQAIGRVRRCGQKKTVHIHRLFARNTIDQEIYEDRTGESIAA